MPNSSTGIRGTLSSASPPLGSRSNGARLPARTASRQRTTSGGAPREPSSSGASRGEPAGVAGRTGSTSIHKEVHQGNTLSNLRPIGVIALNERKCIFLSDIFKGGTPMTPVSREKRRSIVRLLGAAALAVMASSSLTACVVAPTHHRPAPAPHRPEPPHFEQRPDPSHRPGSNYRPQPGYRPGPAYRPGPGYRPAPPPGPAGSPGPHHW